MDRSDEELKGMLELLSEGDNDFIIEVEDLLNSNLKLSDLPPDISLLGFNDRLGYSWNFNCSEKKGYIERGKAISKHNWSRRYTAEAYCLKMMEVVKSWSSEGIVEIDNEAYKEDSENFMFWFFIKVDSNLLVRDAVSFVEKIERIIESRAEASLSKELSDHILEDEPSFSIGILLPLLRRMGYENTQYNHGPQEFGKDIIFSDIDRLGIRRNFSIQVKAGDVSGEADGQLDKIVGQVDDALGMAYNDIYSKEKRLITDVLVVITGRFTKNAQEKICTKIGISDNNKVHFRDIDIIQGWLAKYMPEGTDLL